jgi:hypothetical protein
MNKWYLDGRGTKNNNPINKKYTVFIYKRGINNIITEELDTTFTNLLTDNIEIISVPKKGYKFIYTPHMIGEFKINFKIKGEHVKGSPLVLTAKGPGADSSK